MWNIHRTENMSVRDKFKKNKNRVRLNFKFLKNVLGCNVSKKEKERKKEIIDYDLEMDNYFHNII